MLDTMMPFGESNFPDCSVLALGGVFTDFVQQRKTDPGYVAVSEYNSFITCLQSDDTSVPDIVPQMTTNQTELQLSHYEPFQRYEEVKSDGINWESDCESGEDEEDDEDCEDVVDGDVEDEVFELDENDLTQDVSPDRLLNFAKLATSNVKAIMSRNEGNEDYCDIFEERFKTTLSGRALYYADLLAVAQPNSDIRKRRNNGDKSPNSSAVPSSAKPTQTDYTTRGITICYDATGEVETSEVSIATGKRNEKVGLGPLERLFLLSTPIAAEPQVPYCTSVNNLKRPILQCEYNENLSSGAHLVKQVRLEEGPLYGSHMGQRDVTTSYHHEVQKSSGAEYWESHLMNVSGPSSVASTSFTRTPDFLDISAEWETA